MTHRVLIVGANSAIAAAVAKMYAASGASLVVAARDTERLKLLADDLKVRGAMAVHTARFDALDKATHLSMLKEAFAAYQGLDVVLIAHGSLPDQKKAEASYDEAEREIEINFLSVVSLLTVIANKMQETGSGVIGVISSVAGDCGRQSNYVYGAAKGGLNIFLQGLRNRMAHCGVHVLTIKPGFVATPMTAHLKQGPLFASPEKVAADIVHAIRTKRNVLYTPWFWQFIMLVIRHLPEAIFKRLKL